MSNTVDARIRFQILEQAPTSFLALDSEWRCIYVNPVGAQQLRRTQQELTGSLIWELFPAAVAGPSHLAYERSMRLRETVRIEQYYPPLDCWFDIFAYPIDFDDRVGIGVHFADVTARRRREERLARNEEAMARAQQIAGVGSWHWHIDTEVVQWSAETYRLLAFEADYHPTTAWMEEFVHPDDLARSLEAIEHTLETNARYDLVLRMRPRDGSTRICHVLGEAERDETGRALALFGTMQDITERTRLERAAAQDKRDLQNALRAARMANYAWNIECDVMDWSPEYFELTGLDPATFTPARENVLARIHPDDAAYVRATSAAAIESEGEFEVQYRFLHGDGSWRHMTSVAQVERDSEGMPTRIIGSVRDRTTEVQLDEERLRLERQMQQAQKLESLGVLAGGIAHDFNNLLVGILGNASLAAATPQMPGIARELLSEIERSAQRAADLTHQLLAYAGKGRFIVEPCGLSQLVEEMLALVRSAMSRKAELHLDLACDLLSIAADATQLRQVVMNLLTNASDALEDRPGNIIVRTGMQLVDGSDRAGVLGGDPLPDGRYVYLEVSDTGVGMDAETLARIFDPFFTTKFTGRGLGLAATRGIMQGHRGAIKVYSKPGKGTTFKLLFPAIDEAAVERAQAPRSTSWRGTGTVLVIDDDPAVRRVTRLVLERLGFDVLEAADGLDGLEVYRQHREQIQLTLLDLTMPKLDGEETFRQLRTIDPEVRVVLMSGYNAQNVTTQFVGKGLAGFVQKPFRAVELEAQVRAVLDR